METCNIYALVVGNSVAFNCEYLKAPVNDANYIEAVCFLLLPPPPLTLTNSLTVSVDSCCMTGALSTSSSSPIAMLLISGRNTRSSWTQYARSDRRASSVYVLTFCSSHKLHTSNYSFC
jgi:hypothetical protein